ncbi:MAG: DUF1236 domain-containing protein [Hyphomicrobiaceae bacterium]
MNRYIVSAIALMASTGVAFAQSPKGQDASPPSAKSVAPGQTKSDGGSAQGMAPGQMKSDEGASKSTMPSKNEAAVGNDGEPGKTKMQDRAERSGNGSDDGKSKAGRSQSRNEETTGDKSREAARNGSDKDRAGKSEQSASEPRRDKTGKQAGGHADRKSARIDLKPEQHTKVITTFKHRHVAPATNVKVNISVGTVIPRHVKLHVIPREVLVIAPVYRDYRYFVVDDRIVIVEPDTHEIVDVLIIA